MTKGEFVGNSVVIDVKDKGRLWISVNEGKRNKMTLQMTFPRIEPEPVT